jgi:hypothetical protein
MTISDKRSSLAWDVINYGCSKFKGTDAVVNVTKLFSVVRRPGQNKLDRLSSTDTFGQAY